MTPPFLTKMDYLKKKFIGEKYSNANVKWVCRSPCQFQHWSTSHTQQTELRPNTYTENNQCQVSEYYEYTKSFIPVLWLMNALKAFTKYLFFKSQGRKRSFLFFGLTTPSKSKTEKKKRFSGGNFSSLNTFL